MRVLFVLLLFVSLVLGQNLKIIAPENLAFTVEKIINKFHKKYPNVKVSLIKSSAHDISLEIKNGALVDIAISGNLALLHQLSKEGFLEGEQILFAKDALVIFSFKRVLSAQNVTSLKHNSIEKIALLNPFENSQGKLAIQALKEANLYKQVKPKFIYANSLQKLLSYALHVTDVGIGTKATLLLPSFQKQKKRVDFFTLPWELELAATLVKRYKPNRHAPTFLEFLTSQEAKNILQKSGYSF